MDSRDVNKRIRAVVWPALKERGFEKRSTRTAWRQRAQCVDVINFQSFNSYTASGLGCTTFSFGVNLGIYFPCIADRAWSKTPSREWPQEFECHLRKTLIKRLPQPTFPRLDIWFVDREGSNLEDVIDDALHVIESSGMDWFARFASLEAALEAFRSMPDVGESGQGTESFGGTIGSPARLEKIAGLALELGKHETARDALTKLHEWMIARARSGVGYAYENEAKSITAFLDK